jgi:hypothetical protein
MTKKYTSKISYGLLIIIVLLLIAPLISIIQNGVIDKEIALRLLFMAALLLFVLHVFLNTNYTIDGSKLKIRSGIIPYRPIEISSIREISKTKSLWSSPAPSFDRIVIKYGKYNKMIVSPKDKVAFVKDLCEINPNIVNLVLED